MRIGIFDSGLGGLLIAQSLIAALPQYDYLYLGDTKRVPYGNRSQEAILEFTTEAVTYLFEQDCQVVILACNTASAEALRSIQQEYIPTHYPDRKVLGVIRPSVEAVQTAGAIGILATSSTVASQVFPAELSKNGQNRPVIQQAAPLLVPLIEYGGIRWIQPILEDYLTPFKGGNVDTLILGCTHYAAIKKLVRDLLPGVQVISQDEVMPASFRNYLAQHPEQETLLAQRCKRTYQVTDLTQSTFEVEHIFSVKEISLEKVSL